MAKSSVASIPVLGSARKCSTQVWDINLLPWPNVQMEREHCVFQWWDCSSPASNIHLFYFTEVRMSRSSCEQSPLAEIECSSQVREIHSLQRLNIQVKSGTSKAYSS